MTRSLRRLAACLLLVILPLQAFANIGVVSCAETMPHCPGMQAADGAGCCEHGMSAQGSGIAHATHASDSQSDMSPCAGATTCAPAMSAAAVLPAMAPIAVVPAEETWRSSDPSSCLSFIPDGLHRPPNHLA